MSGECQVNVKSQSELDIGGRETCKHLNRLPLKEPSSAAYVSIANDDIITLVDLE